MPVHPAMVKALAAPPPVRLATSMLARVISARPETVSRVSDRVKSAFAVATTRSAVPPLPVRLPVPVQPLMSNVLVPAPPARSATSMLVRAMLARPVTVSRVSDRVKFALAVATTRSAVPPPPVRLPVPVQPERSKVLLLAPPVRSAASTWEN